MYSNLNIVVAKEDGTSKTLKYSIKNTALAQAWARALHEDYLTNDDVVMAKEFFLHAWGASNPRSKSWLCNELNYHIDRVNEYFNDNNIDYKVDMKFSAITVNQSQLNDIHRHFELIQGHHKETTDIWNNANDAFRWSVNQFNHMCHELEGHLYLEEYGQSNTGTMIVCLYPNNKHPITEQQLSEFEMKNYKKGDVRLHYPQTGRQFIEAYLHSDENVPMDEIEPIKYISGEFDLMFHDINVDWDGFKTWLEDNNVDQSNPQNALGYATVAHGDIPDDIFDYSDITCVQLEREWPHIGVTRVLAEKTFPHTGIKQYMYQRDKYYKTTVRPYTQSFINAMRSELYKHADTKTIVELKHSYKKIIINNNVILPSNAQYYESIYGSIDAGIEDIVNKINTMDDNIILDYEYKHNYYLEFTTKKVYCDYQLHSKQLVEQFQNIEEYVLWFKRNVWKRKQVFGKHNFTDYHLGNVYVTWDLKWRVIDFDDIVRFSVDGSSDDVFWQSVLDKFLVSNRTNLSNNYVLDNWNREQLIKIWNSTKHR